ncbi:MAG: adenylyltransferase/cytidyltransferase family protein [Clostridia bacterium]|nr:adenylyltransferase/cytidyltransferase family protein [Clostridia bacterium]
MKDLGTFNAGVEFITLKLIEKIERFKGEYLQIAIGVYTDECFEKIFDRKPIKPYEERVRLANSIKGVDWVFKASVADQKQEIRNRVSPLYVRDDAPKQYHVGYAPGTYDLFHEGHLQHLLECRVLCDIMVVGVNSDNLVYLNKGKKAKMSQEDRMRVVKNLKFVDYVHLVEENDKRRANEWAKAIIGEPIDVIILGSDLEGQDYQNPEGLMVIFTERDPMIMQKRCSTFWREMVTQFLGDDTLDE